MRPPAHFRAMRNDMAEILESASEAFECRDWLTARDRVIAKFCGLGADDLYADKNE